MSGRAVAREKTNPLPQHDRGATKKAADGGCFF